MRSWWTKLALEQFEERTKCFVKQYSNYALDGQNENGQRTLSNFVVDFFSHHHILSFHSGENIADNGGLKLAYRAYQSHRQRTVNSGNNFHLPGLPYNNDQLFFIAFAHV